MNLSHFAEGRGKRVLEIGAGSDFHNWVKNGKEATGIDLATKAIALTYERFALNGENSSTYELLPADAEKSPFYIS
jgi:hypothetical protein